MKRRVSGRNDPDSPKKSKKSGEASSKPPPSPAAKVLITRALHGGRPSLERLRRRSGFDADQSVNASMMNKTTDTTLDKSTFEKVLNKSNWWKDIDESMLNIPLADLTGDKSQDITLDNTTDSSNILSKRKGVKEKKNKTSKKQKSDRTTGKEVLSSSSVVGDEADHNEAESTKTTRQKSNLEIFKKAMGSGSQPKAPTNETTDRESVVSDITEDDPPTPQTEKQSKRYIRQTRRVSYATFKKAMGKSSESPGQDDENLERESLASDITDDPPTPVTEKQSKRYVRQTRRVSYATFKEAMGKSSESPEQDDEQVDRISLTSDITEDPPTPKTEKQSKRYVRQTRRVSYATFKEAMGKSSESPEQDDENLERESLTSDITEDPPTPKTEKQSKKYVGQTRRVSYATFKEAMGKSSESPEPKDDEQVDRISLTSDITEDPPTPKTEKQSKRYVRQTQRVSYATFKEAMGKSSESPEQDDENLERVSLASDIIDNPPTPKTEKQSKRYVRQTRRVSYATFKKAMGKSSESPEPKDDEQVDRISLTSDITDDPPTPMTEKQSKRYVRQTQRVSHATFKKAMGKSSESFTSKVDENVDRESATSDTTEEDSETPDSEKQPKKNVARQTHRVSYNTFKNAMDATLNTTDKHNKSVTSKSSASSVEDSPSPQKKKSKRQSYKYKVSNSMFKDAMGPITESDSPKETIIDSSHVSDDDASPTIAKKVYKEKSFSKGRVSASEFKRVMQEISTAEIQQQKKQTPSPKKFDDDSVTELSPPSSKGKQKRRTTPVTGEMFAAAMQVASITPSPTKATQLSMSFSDDSGTGITGNQSQEKKQRSGSRISNQNVSKVIKNSRPSKSPKADSSFLGTVIDIVEDNSLVSTSANIRKQSLDEAAMETSATEHSKSIELTPIAIRRSASKRLSFTRTEQILSSTSTPGSRPSMTTIPEHGLLDIITEPLVHTRESHHKSIAEVSTPTISVLKEFDLSDVNQKSTRKEDKSTSQQMEKSIFARNSLSAFVSKGPVRHSESPSSPSKSKKNVSILNRSDSKNKSQKEESQVTSEVLPTSPRSSLEISEDNTDKQSPKSSAEHSDAKATSSTSTPNLSLVQLPHHSKHVEGNTSSSNNQSIAKFLNVCVVLEKIPDLNPEEMPKRKSPYKNSLLSSKSPTSDETHLNSLVVPKNFTSFDFNDALELLEKELTDEIDEDYGSAEESIEEGKQPKVRPEKTKFSLSDFKRAMESLTIDNEEIAIHTGEESSALRRSGRMRPRKSESEDMDNSTPRKSPRLSRGPEPPESARRSTRLAAEAVNMSIESKRRSTGLAAEKMNISTTSPNKNNMQKSPSKSFHSNATETNLSLSNPRKSILSNTIPSQFEKISDVSKAKVYTPVRFSLPAKDSSKTRKSAFKKRYTLLDFQRAMEAVRSPSFATDSPSTSNKRDSVPKFSVHDFEKAVSTFRVDIDDSYDSLSLSRRTTLSSSLRHAQTIQNDNSLMASKPSNKSPVKDSPSKQQNIINTSGRRLRSSPTKPQQDLNSSTLSLRSGKTVSPSKQLGDLNKSSSAQNVNKTQTSPLKQQELNSSTLSLRSGKTMSPSKQLGDLNKSSSAQNVNKTQTSPLKQQELNSSTLSLRSGRTMSPSKQLGDLNKSSSAQNVNKTQTSPLKQQELNSSTLSLRSGKTMSPSKQLGDLNKSSSSAAKTSSQSKLVETSSLSSISDNSFKSPQKVQHSTLRMPKTALVASSKNAIASPTSTSPTKLNKSLDTASQSHHETTVADTRTSKSLGVFEFKQSQRAVITEVVPDTSASSGSNVSEEIPIVNVESISTANAMTLFQNNDEIKEDIEHEVIELHSESSEEDDKSQETIAPKESSSKEVDTLPAQDSSSEEEEEAQETTAPQESSSAEDEEEEDEQETTAPQESSSEEDEEEVGQQETTAPQESSSEEDEEEVGQQETTAPQESSSEEDVGQQETTAPQAPSSEEDVGQQETTAPQASSSEEDEEDEQETTAPQESSSEEDEEEGQQETTAPQESSSEEEEEEEEEQKTATLQESSSELEEVEDGQEQENTGTMESSSDGEERDEHLNNTVFDLSLKNNVENDFKEKNDESDVDDTEEAPNAESSSSSPNSLELQQSLSDILPTEESIDTERSLLLSVSQQEQQNSAQRNLSDAFSQQKQQQMHNKPRNLDALKNVLKGINNMAKESRNTNFEQSKILTKLTKMKPQTATTQKPRQQKPIPVEKIINGKVYRKPRLSRPKPWINDRFYKYLEKHFIQEDSHKYRKLSENFALELAEYVTKTISSKSKVEQKAQKVANLVKKVGLVKTNMEFFHFSQNYLPEPFVFKAFPYNEGTGVRYFK